MCPGHEIGRATLKNTTSSLPHQFFFFLPQSFSTPSTQVLFSHLNRSPPRPPSSIFKSGTHYSFSLHPLLCLCSLFTAVGERAFRLSRPRVEPILSPHPSHFHPFLPLIPPPLASHNLMKSDLDRFINNASRLKQTTRFSLRAFFYIWELDADDFFSPLPHYSSLFLFSFPSYDTSSANASFLFPFGSTKKKRLCDHLSSFIHNSSSPSSFILPSFLPSICPESWTLINVTSHQVEQRLWSR